MKLCNTRPVIKYFQGKRVDSQNNGMCVVRVGTFAAVPSNAEIVLQLEE